jgi:hypothetical protein
LTHFHFAHPTIILGLCPSTVPPSLLISTLIQNQYAALQGRNGHDLPRKLLIDPLGVPGRIHHKMLHILL